MDADRYMVNLVGGANTWLGVWLLIHERFQHPLWHHRGHSLRTIFVCSFLESLNESCQSPVTERSRLLQERAGEVRFGFISRRKIKVWWVNHNVLLMLKQFNVRYAALQAAAGLSQVGFAFDNVSEMSWLANFTASVECGGFSLSASSRLGPVTGEPVSRFRSIKSVSFRRRRFRLMSFRKAKYRMKIKWIHQ